MADKKETNEQMCELKDIILSIHRYNATHREGVFLYGIVGYKKDPDHKCVDCGENMDIVDDNKSLLGAFGDLETLRIICCELRDMIEDEADEDCFVNV